MRIKTTEQDYQKYTNYQWSLILYMMIPVTLILEFVLWKIFFDINIFVIYRGQRTFYMPFFFFVIPVLASYVKTHFVYPTYMKKNYPNSFKQLYNGTSLYSIDVNYRSFFAVIFIMLSCAILNIEGFLVSSFYAGYGFEEKINSYSVFLTHFIFTFPSYLVFFIYLYLDFIGYRKLIDCYAHNNENKGFDMAN